MTLASQPTAPHYYLFDGLGSTTGLVSPTATLSASYSYDAWGNILSETGQVSQPYRFTTRPYNPTSGFVDLRARVYDPGTGIFIQVDPLGLEPDTNLDRYVGNEPTNHTDPKGLLIGGIIGGEVGCAVRIRNEVWEMPEREDDPSGRILHCVASCRISRECLGGRVTAIVVGEIQERRGRVDDLCDRKANEVGRELAKDKSKTCVDACNDAANERKFPLDAACERCK